MTTLETIAALKPSIQQWTRGWMLSESTGARGVQLGLRDADQFWIVGRAGVLGDCPAAVAAGGLAFLSPSHVSEAWNGLPASLDVRAVLAEYAQCIHDWGSSELPRFGEAKLGRLNELGRRIARGSDASLGLVFTGWQALPEPEELGARVALTMHVLREQRGAAHIVALHACGLTPLQAILASPAPPPRSGPVWAEHLGWTGPFEDASALTARRAHAEELTNEILVTAYDSLAPAELDEFAELCRTIRADIDM